MIRISLSTLAAAITFGFAPSLSHAAGSALNGWVSGNGTDTAGCGPVTTPCRTFQYVHDNVVIAGGQIRVKDPGGYGPIVITMAVSIINDGVGFAGISAPSGDAISVQAGSGEVLIKGLSLDGAGTGNTGIHLVSAGKLTVANCTITGFGAANVPNGVGILIMPPSGTVNFSVSDTFVTGSHWYGIAVVPGWFGGSTAVVNGAVTRVETDNQVIGLVAQAFGSSTVTVLANQVTATGNTFGFDSGSSATALYLTRSVAIGNGTGITISGPTYTYGDNDINGNGTGPASDVVGGTLTPVAPK